MWGSNELGHSRNIKIIFICLSNTQYAFPTKGQGNLMDALYTLIHEKEFPFFFAAAAPSIKLINRIQCGEQQKENSENNSNFYDVSAFIRNEKKKLFQWELCQTWLEVKTEQGQYNIIIHLIHCIGSV